MQSTLDHVKINSSDPSFYKALLTYLDFKIVHEYARGFGAEDGSVGLWVFKTAKKYQREVSFQTTGLNHLAFQVNTKEDVNKFYKDYLLSNKIPILHEPKEYTAYNQGKGYYAVFFEDPDHIKLEVAWVAE